MKTSPTQRSLKHLRALGYEAAVVEKWNAFAKIRQDLFGWIDIIAVHAEKPGVLGVQTTTTANLQARLEKARGNGRLIKWLLAGGRLTAHGWAKRGPRGEPKVWQIKEVDLTVSDLAAVGDGGGDGRTS